MAKPSDNTASTGALTGAGLWRGLRWGMVLGPVLAGLMVLGMFLNMYVQISRLMPEQNVLYMKVVPSTHENVVLDWLEPATFVDDSADLIRLASQDRPLTEATVTILSYPSYWILVLEFGVLFTLLITSLGGTWLYLRTRRSTRKD